MGTILGRQPALRTMKSQLEGDKAPPHNIGDEIDIIKNIMD